MGFLKCILQSRVCGMGFAGWSYLNGGYKVGFVGWDKLGWLERVSLLDGVCLLRFAG